MKPYRARTSPCAALTAVALAISPVACKDDPKTEPAAGADAKGEAPADGGGEAKADGQGNEKDSGAKPGGLAAKALAAAGAVVGPRDFQPSYPVGLDTLLDLVPADVESFLVVRDVGSLVEGTLAYAEAQKSTLLAGADMMAKTDPGDAEELRKALDTLAKVGPELDKSGIDLAAGLVFAKSKGAEGEMMVYGSAKADAFPAMLTALGSTSDDVPTDCVVLASAAGYSVCGKAGAASFAPANKAADLRARVGAALPGVDLERANVVALFEDDGKDVPIVVETGLGMAHVAFAIPGARDELAKVLTPGKAAALGVIGAGQPFVWAQLSPEGVKAQMGPPPAMATAFVDALTGEVVMGGLDGMRGFTMAAGVSDATPAAGLVSLASLGLGEIPKTLPDGTKLEVGVETVKTAASGVQALHAKFTGGAQEKIVADLGYASEIFAFAAGGFAAVSLGAGQDVVGHLGGYTGTGPSEELLASLPAPLATALKDGKAAAAVHAPFDALQAESAYRAFDALVDQIPMEDLGASDPKVVTRVSIDAMAPLSSASLWVTDLDQGPVFHVAVQGFGVVGTEEGKAAFDALAAVGGGADRKSTYAALAGKYPSSTRVASYKARAGEIGDPVGSLIIVGTLGATMGALFFLSAVESISKVSAPPPAPVAPPPPVAPTVPH